MRQRCVLADALAWRKGKWLPSNLVIVDGVLQSVGDGPIPLGLPTIDCKGLHVFPGFTDVHVHLREPGFSYKETIQSGTRAAARGGYTTVCAMPKLRPVPDSQAHLQQQRDIIARDACIQVLPYGSITMGQKGEELSHMAALAPQVCGFTDDGRGVQSEALMEQAMAEAKKHRRILAAHCEDDGLLHGGVIHAGAYADKHQLPGISSASEYRQLRRDLDLVRRTRCSYHMCHLSTKESLALISRAKAEGLDVTCETAPHYLLLDESCLSDDGRYKMNPPLRGPEDRAALTQGLLDGTIDMIATDHAPHSAQEKAGGLMNSLNGIVGLECAFALLNHYFVQTGLMPLHRLVTCMSEVPNRRFGIEGGLIPGKPASLCLWDLQRSVTVDPSAFLSLGRSTPFAGWQAAGACVLTIAQGCVAWKEAL
ncbi:MAG: dihydroorotase [Clostridiales bacterium]|nr:dihydroorotase [Clostridiales bacterium]